MHLQTSQVLQLMHETTEIIISIIANDQKL